MLASHLSGISVHKEKDYSNYNNYDSSRCAYGSHAHPISTPTLPSAEFVSHGNSVLVKELNTDLGSSTLFIPGEGSKVNKMYGQSQQMLLAEKI